MAKTRLPSPFAVLRRETGAALLMALFSTMVLMVIATEMMYQTTVEAKVSSQSVNQVKAYYSAKAAVELGLLRVFAYRAVVASVGDAIPDKSILDMIYTFPLSWPPDLGENMTMVTKDAIATSTKESLVKGSWSMSISGEGAKIDINDIASPSKVVAEATRKQIGAILDAQVRDNEEFAKNNRNLDVPKLLNNIVDWIDEDKTSLNGGDERAPYSNLPVDGPNDNIPPNQPFKTLGELHMVAGVSDEIFNLLAPRITIFGTKGINVNNASKEVIQSLDESITPEIAAKIIEQRSDPNRGPFKNLDDFIGVLQSLGVNTSDIAEGKEEKIPLIFDAEYNFRIIGTGKAGPVVKEITAVTYDVDSVKTRLGEFLAKQRAGENGGDGSTNPPPPPPPGAPPAPPNPSTPKTEKSKIPKGRPNVVYWVES